MKSQVDLFAADFQKLEQSSAITTDSFILHRFVVAAGAMPQTLVRHGEIAAAIGQILSPPKAVLDQVLGIPQVFLTRRTAIPAQLFAARANNGSPIQ